MQFLCSASKLSSIIKNATIAFYKEKQQIYQETDALGVGLGASVLQVRDGRWYPQNEATNGVVL